jgi:hypothetical protein
MFYMPVGRNLDNCLHFTKHMISTNIWHRKSRNGIATPKARLYPKERYKPLIILGLADYHACIHIPHFLHLYGDHLSPRPLNSLAEDFFYAVFANTVAEMHQNGLGHKGAGIEGGSLREKAAGMDSQDTASKPSHCLVCNASYNSFKVYLPSLIFTIFHASLRIKL